jgi:hypothetical protein
MLWRNNLVSFEATKHFDTTFTYKYLAESLTGRFFVIELGLINKLTTKIHFYSSVKFLKDKNIHILKRDSVLHLCYRTAHFYIVFYYRGHH